MPQYFIHSQSCTPAPLRTEQAAFPTSGSLVFRDLFIILGSTHALEDFKLKHKSEKTREELIEGSKKEKPWGHFDRFSYSVDNYELHECPACNGMGVMGGTQYDEEISEDQDPDDPFTEYVELTYATEEFVCFVCELHLQGAQEINATSLPDEFYDTEEREREFEPDYGND